jgi:hypothetical protein
MSFAEQAVSRGRERLASVPESMPCMGCIRHFPKNFPESTKTLKSFGCGFSTFGTSGYNLCCTRKGSCETVRFSVSKDLSSLGVWQEGGLVSFVCRGGGRNGGAERTPSINGSRG